MDSHIANGIRFASYAVAAWAACGLFLQCSRDLSSERATAGALRVIAFLFLSLLLFFFSFSATAHDLCDPDEIVIVNNNDMPQNAGDGSPTIDWIGQITSFHNDTYVINVTALGDHIFVENFEPYDFAGSPDGWEFWYATVGDQSFLGDQACGRQVLDHEHFVLINCDVVQPNE